MNYKSHIFRLTTEMPSYGFEDPIWGRRFVPVLGVSFGIDFWVSDMYLLFGWQPELNRSAHIGSTKSPLKQKGDSLFGFK